MDSLISIIVPVHNIENYIESCVDSIRKQTYKNLEMIFADDGSIDKSLEILRRYEENDSRIKVITQANSGVSVARNNAMKYASGEYVMFVDGDDWIELDTCAQAIKTAINENADIVMWSYIRERSGSSSKKNIIEGTKIFSGDEVQKTLQRRMIGIVGNELSQPENADALCPVWGKLYKRDIISQHGIEFLDIKEIGTYEDGLFNLEFFKYAKKAVFIEEYFYHYRRDNAMSITTKYNDGLRQQWDHLFEIMQTYIRDNGLGNEYQDALSNRIALSLIALGINEMSKEASTRTKIANIKELISESHRQKAISSLDLKYMPVHWKAFFGFAKHNCAVGLYGMLEVIQIIRSR